MTDYPKLLMEFDKAGAEWVVVAYLTGDSRMIQVCEGDESPHVVTGKFMTNCPEDIIKKENKLIGHSTDPIAIKQIREEHCLEIFEAASAFLPRTMSIRQCGKKSNHGLNYDEKYKTFALMNEIDEREAKKIISLYTKHAYPGIPIWHENIRRQLQDTRTLTNCFGRQCRFLDQWGGDLFRSAYAFLPQSTVVDMVNQGMLLGYMDESPEFENFDLLAQVHDSILIQEPVDDWERIARLSIKLGLEYMSPTLQYSGREFNIDTDLKIGLDWGETSHDDPSKGMHEISLVDDVDKMVETFKETWEKLHESKA